MDNIKEHQNDIIKGKKQIQKIKPFLIYRII